MPVARTTSVHAAISVRSRAVTAAGSAKLTNVPASSARRRTSGSASTARSSRVRRCNTGPGVAAGRVERVPDIDRIVRQAGFRQRGHVGQRRVPLLSRRRDRAQAPVADEGDHGRRRVHVELDAAREQVCDRLPRAAVGHMHQLDPHAPLQKLAAQMVQRSVACRSVVDLSRPCARTGDEFLQRAHGQGGMDHHDLRRVGELRDGREIRDRVHIRRALHRGPAGHAAGIADHQRMPVRPRALGCQQADGAVAAGPVLHHHRYAELRRERIGDQPRGEIGPAAGRRGDDDGDRARREFLRPRCLRERQRARAEDRAASCRAHLSRPCRR